MGGRIGLMIDDHRFPQSLPHTILRTGYRCSSEVHLLGRHASSRSTYKDFNSCLYLSWSPIQYQTTVFPSLTARARKSKFTLTDQILSAEFTHLKWSDGWKESFFQSPNLVSACFLISSDNSLYESQYDFTVNEFFKVSSSFLPYGP